MLSELLKKESKIEHDSIEHSLNLMTMAREQKKYRLLLSAFYSFYQVIEPKLQFFQKEFYEKGIDLSQRSKLHLLRDDLINCGLTNEEIDNLPKAQFLPDMEDIDQAMGILYVLEGSTLGGQIVFKLLNQSGIVTEGIKRGSFFYAYGADTGQMWQTFKRSLDGIHEDEHQKVLASVKSTFSNMEKSLTLITNR